MHVSPSPAPAGTGLRPAALLRFVIAALLHRGAATALQVGSIALGAFALLVAGSLGVAVWEEQRHALADRLPERIVALAPDVGDAGRRFNASCVAALEALPGVARVVPQIELFAEVGVAGGARVEAIVEGVAGADPRTAPERLSSGLAPRTGALEAVVTRSLERLIAGEQRLAAGSASLVMQVTRTRAGVAERRAIELRIVGVLEREPAERLYVPLDLAEELDLWALHKSGPGGTRAGESCMAPAGGDDPDAPLHEYALSGWCDGVEVPLLATASADERDGLPVLAGRLPAIGSREIVVGVSQLERLDRRASLEIAFEPLRDELRAPVALRFVACGLAAGGRARIDAHVAAQLVAWQRGELHYDAARGAFMTPRDAYLAAGHVRANVFAAAIDDVERVVGALRERGFDTHDSLADLAALHHLGELLLRVVLFVVAGYVASGAINALVVSALGVRARLWEIGVLASFGLTRREIVRGFALQGALIGLAALLLAWGAHALLGASIRTLVAEALGGTGGAAVSTAPLPAWLLALALLIALASALAGSLLPALVAVLRPPAATLAGRE